MPATGSAAKAQLPLRDGVFSRSCATEFWFVQYYRVLIYLARCLCDKIISSLVAFDVV